MSDEDDNDEDAPRSAVRIVSPTTHQRSRNGQIFRPKSGLEILGWGMVAFYTWRKYRGIFTDEHSFREAIQTLPWVEDGQVVLVEAPRRDAWGTQSSSDGHFDYAVARSNGSYRLVAEVKYFVNQTHKPTILTDFKKLTHRDARAADERYFIYVGDDENISTLGWPTKQSRRHDREMWRKALEASMEPHIDVERSKISHESTCCAGDTFSVRIRYRDARKNVLYFKNAPESVSVTHGHTQFSCRYDHSGWFKYWFVPRKAQKGAKIIVSCQGKQRSLTIQIDPKSAGGSSSTASTADYDATTEVSVMPPSISTSADATDFVRVFRLDCAKTLVDINGDTSIHCVKVFDTKDLKPLDTNAPVRVIVWKIDIAKRHRNEQAKFEKLCQED